MPSTTLPPMKFVSTRGQAPVLGFADALLAGLASDGGLYLPAHWPQIGPGEIAGFAGRPFAEIAAAVIGRFTAGAIPSDTLREMLDAAYAGFRHPSTTPLVELAPGHYLLELFHGPTLAFKDVAMQFLARAMDHVLSERGARATIVGATSGDTGSAAIEAFRGRDNLDIFILHPRGRTSEVQRRQMTTVMDANVHNLAIKGTFDDCQRIVKALFGDRRLREETRLSGVNSINFGRIVAQIVYYFKAAADLGAPHRKVGFTVPTGNFGDVFAGYAARRMGLGIDRLVIATNENDILARTLATGRSEIAAVVPTSSPSMDIQVSSNFERLLFEAGGRDADAVRAMMASLGQSGGFTVPPSTLAAIRADFDAETVGEDEVRETIAGTRAGSGYLLDPHGAVGVAAAARRRVPGTAMITLATAHPAKFPDAVRRATSIEPALPPWLADLGDRPERCDVLDDDVAAVADYIRARSRASAVREEEIS